MSGSGFHRQYYKNKTKQTNKQNQNNQEKYNIEIVKVFQVTQTGKYMGPMTGRIMAPRDVHTLILGVCEDMFLPGKG
jgi:cephalosporin-C deacetylase-like acetyl esterase